MKRFLQNLRGMFGKNPPLLTPEDFTDHYVAAFLNAAPQLKAEIIKPLELKITLTNGENSTAFLYNAYEIYQQAPQLLEETVTKYIVASLDTFQGMSDEIDRTRIVPIIKDRAWLEETQKALAARGREKPLEWVSEDFSPDLVILYAEDLPKNIRYLTPDHLKTLQMEMEGLRDMAIENLRNLLPPVECRGIDGLYLFRAGGDYEASLLLSKKIWSSGQIKVDGEIVVAIPTRDVLLATGSENAAGLERMRAIAKEAYETGSYRLTPKLFVYRNEKFEWFGPDVSLN